LFLRCILYSNGLTQALLAQIEARRQVLVDALGQTKKERMSERLIAQERLAGMFISI
jgi:hypothetical protein